ncbi:hypothetical protein [Geminisphaera colitermitum]|uniref:hypothetical protein n=1 Tax=Geminisphaera colitermitum TaxID=1148786 RepID=UPI000158CECA|nr:hypothetical protein [Geminisphaera colitermitum]
MGGKGDEPQPADYAAAQQEALYTQYDLLPSQRMLEQAASQGKKIQYVDPRTGETKTADFTGLGDFENTKAYVDLLAQVTDDMSEKDYARRLEYGIKNAQAAADEVKAADPLAYEVRQDVTQKIKDQVNAETETFDPSADLAREAARAGSEGQASQNMTALLAQLAQEYQLGGQLDAQTQRQLTDQTRSGQAARGNYLGDAAAVVESATMGQAAEARKQQRLGNLMTGIGQEAQLAQLGIGAAQAQANEERSARAETWGHEQQALSNASAIVLGQPITNQFGSLAAAQQGAAPGAANFAGLVQSGTNFNANAGSEIFQMQGQNYKTQMENQQDSPWMSLLGGAAGAAMMSI